MRLVAFLLQQSGILPVTAAMTDRIAAQGVFAVIRCRAPLAELLEVGDALLATPLTVLAIAPGSREPWAAIAELRARFGHNMAVGAGLLSTQAEVTAALAAGAQFVLTANYHAADSHACHGVNALYVPCVATSAALDAALVAAHRTFLLFPANRADTFTLAAKPAAAGVRWLALGGVTPDNVATFARRGVSAVGLRGVLPVGLRLNMAAMIRQMRRVVQAWREGSYRQA
jgi:2-keto-3-deoxy-6-phosphogluconate aldolase